MISNPSYRIQWIHPVRSSLFAFATRRHRRAAPTGILLCLTLGLAWSCLMPISAHADGPLDNLAWISSGISYTQSLAWGDYDGDGDLDLAVGSSGPPSGPYQANRLYRNDGEGSFTELSNPFGSDTYLTESVAWGDYDGDGDLDLAVGNVGEANQLYRNDGPAAGSGWTFTELSDPFGSGTDWTRSMAWGDYDGDGDLDLAVGNDGQVNQLYRNDGPAAGSGWTFTELSNPFGSDTYYTSSVAWADYDGDGDLDLAIGNLHQVNQLYRNDGGGSFTGLGTPFGSSTYDTSSVAWGDYDGDGDLDLAAGNAGAINQLYRNDGGGSFTEISNPFGFYAYSTRSVVWGDYDGDGDLDLAVGDAPWYDGSQWVGGQNRLFRNDGGDSFTELSTPFSSDEYDTNSVVWGDYDGDGDLDFAVGNWMGVNQLFRNDGGGGFTELSAPFGSGTHGTTSVAWGDYDGDGDLDLAVGNYAQVNQLYRNDGSGGFTELSIPFGSDAYNTTSVAWGDYDGDGDLDLAIGNAVGVDQLFRNDGGDSFFQLTDPFGSDTYYTMSVAWGDYDGDGDLDLAVGNLADVNQILRNDGLSAGSEWTFTELSDPFGSDTYYTMSIAWGDYDGDGDLDLAAGNSGQVNQLYHNDGGDSFTKLSNPFGLYTYSTSSAAWGDYDGDGDLDLAVGSSAQVNQLYRNEGSDGFAVDSFGAVISATQSVAWGDYDGDGDLDLAVGNNGEANQLLQNTRQGGRALPNNASYIRVTAPYTASADYYAASIVVDSLIVPITYTLFDPEGDPVGEVKASYSPDGGGRWLPAVVTGDTITTNLATNPQTNIKSNGSTGGLVEWGLHAGIPSLTHVLKWDTFASGFFGQSDNVVFRMAAYPQPSTSAITDTYHYPNSAHGLFQRPYASATTFPFRVRGTQVRVYSETVHISNTVENAMVYRLPEGQPTGGFPLADGSGAPFRTDNQGYLQGRGEIGLGDHLFAMLPITWTESYTLYYTSGTPTEVGLDTLSVVSPGVQALTVTAAHPLLLFNLDVSLEWDAHDDVVFMEKLQYDLLRAAEYLYDFTDGQATLGEVYVFHDAENWQTAHMRVYANNRLRPNAVLGGMISGTLTDTLVPTITYEAGQIRMPATWNRYGDPSGSMGEDWPRTLAHEFGHYYLFLDDHYLGLNENGQVISIYTCTNTAMTDPYRYSEYRDQADWLPACADTVANHLTGRSDWATIEAFYSPLAGPDARGHNDGPTLMPFNFTEVTVFDPLTPTQTLADPTFYFLTEGGQRYQPAEGTRGFLLKDDTWLLDVGEPVVDHILARGARPGDRLCVFDTANSRLGCEDIQTGDDQVVLYTFPDWHPEIVVSPVMTNSIAVTVHTTDSLSLQGRIFSTDGPATEAFDFAEMVSGTYTTTITSTNALLLEGFVQIWVSEAAPRREMITDYSIGASPGVMRGHGGVMRGHGGVMRGHGGVMRGHGGVMRGHGVPILSGDGQVTVYTPDPTLPDGEFLTVQAATGVPELPPGRVQIGQAYRIAATTGITNLNEGSISFQYLGEAVPAGMEEDITIYYWNGAAWHTLPTMLNTWDNFASAQIPGSGLYALLTAFRVPLYAPGWNMFSYPLRISQPVTEALVSIAGEYSVVYGYDATEPAWEAWDVYGVGVPDYVNDLEELAFGRGYWISVSRAITMYFGDTGEENTLSALSLPPHVPATYYGQILEGAGPGETLAAWVGDSLCGQGQTMEVGGQVVYAVNVMAEAGGLPGCGAAGRAIIFQVGSRVMFPPVAWDDSRLWEVRLSDSAMPFRVYLPLVLKGE